MQFKMQNTNQIPESRRCKPATYEYKKSSFADIFEVLQYLRHGEVFCDVKLETDDNKLIFAHKVILASASPYFHAMFTNFAERNQDLVVMTEIDYTALLLLVNFIYTGKIIVTEENVQVLLPAANLLQLQEVKEACCEFFQSQLCPTNFIGVKAIADLYSCTKLLASSELYIQQHISEVVVGDEFLSLPSEQVNKLISSDKLTVSSEEKVYECVIRWVKHELSSRKCILPHLMENVRLPLISKHYILKKLVEDPLIKNCLKCNRYIIEALHFQLLTPEEFNSQDIRYKPRHGDKVIFMVGDKNMRGIETDSTEWFDPKMNRFNFGSEMITSRRAGGIAVVNDNSVFAVGIYHRDLPLRSVEILDLSSESPCWKPSVDMLVEREHFGVGVINYNLYVVGGTNKIDDRLNSAEVFDFNTQEWRMISSMFTKRSHVGVGVLNNLLYVVGGRGLSLRTLNTVECYISGNNSWTQVAKMSVCRSRVGVGVLDGVLYAVGGYDGSKTLSSVEAYRPSTGVWTSVADMHFPRRHAGVVALDGLLYVVGGSDRVLNVKSVECYNPKTNTWNMVNASLNHARALSGVVAVNRSQHFNTY